MHLILQMSNELNACRPPPRGAFGIRPTLLTKSLQRCPSEGQRWLMYHHVSHADELISVMVDIHSITVFNSSSWCRDFGLGF